MIKRTLVLALLSLAFSARASFAAPGEELGPDELVPSRDMPAGVRQAASQAEAQTDETPPALRWMLKPLKRGMFVRIPVIDTDPNRGITYGIMPIIVLQGKDSERIEQIHAPSLTYNEDFKLSPTYRYYYYPQDDASFSFRASRAKFEHEVMAEYVDHSVFRSPYDVLLRVHQNADAGQRFFGLGPDSPKSAEANYKQEFWSYKVAFGAPFGKDSPWRARLSERYIASRVLNGPLKGLPDFDDQFPAQFSEHDQQTNETRLAFEYDTRDHSVTTGRGAYAQVFAEKAARGFLSQYDYERYGTDLRWFHPWEKLPDHVFAVQASYEQLLGPTPPFWILPSMGGKYSLRAYGDGRYVDRGTATLNAEERMKVYEARTAGVTTEIQFAPFVGLGSVFDAPQYASAKYVRPVVGAAVRAVAKPQVVGSVDFGVGREGLSVFTDINYSF